MQDTLEAQPGRRVRIHTVQGVVEGLLHMAPRIRTLDDLNQTARTFLTIHDPAGYPESWSFGAGPLALNKSRILFVTETEGLHAGPGKGGAYSRASMGLQVQDYDVRGFVHIPRSGDPFMRLNQDQRPFLALTAALVLGADVQFTTPFLAVNRNFILAAQEIRQGAEDPAAMPAFEAES